MHASTCCADSRRELVADEGEVKSQKDGGESDARRGARHDDLCTVTSGPGKKDVKAAGCETRTLFCLLLGFWIFLK